jgi:hypothetical protein
MNKLSGSFPTASSLPSFCRALTIARAEPEPPRQAKIERWIVRGKPGIVTTQRLAIANGILSTQFLHDGEGDSRCLTIQRQYFTTSNFGTPLQMSIFS